MEDKKRYGIQVKLLFLGWAIISVLLFIQLLVTEWFRPDLFTSLQIVAYPTVRLILGYLVIVVLIIPSYNYLGRKPNTIRVLGLLLVGLLFVLSYTASSVAVFLTIFEKVNLELFIGSLIEEVLTFQHHIITYYLMLISMLFAIDYFRDKLHAVQNRERLEKELSNTKLLMLRNQLQPHFLFNTLNGISSIIDDRKEVAQDMIADLSELLRASLQMDFSRKIELGKELALLDSYLNIEKRRFEHQLAVEVEIPTDLYQEKVLPFILQPLVENAIKHGFNQRTKQLKIRLGAKLENEKLLISIANDGYPLEKNDRPGIGIKNLKERLRGSYEEKATFSIQQQEQWVINIIELKR